MFKKLVAILIAFIMVFALCSCKGQNIAKLSEDLQGALNVHFIDVGQGDCIMLESQSAVVLIDAGETEYADFVCEYLKSYDIKTIDYVIATHPHSDHCGGLKKVIDTFECKNFITAQSDQQTKVWLDVLDAVEKNDVNYIDAKIGTTYSFGESVFEILGPCNSQYENYNNYSVIVKAMCGDTSFLFTGDAEKLSEYEMIENGADLNCDVLKVGHHGSSTSTSGEFLSFATPSYAVITCGKNNEYGHPHKETTNSLRYRGITTYRTDELGTIIASSDKENITFYYTDSNTVVQAPSQSIETEISYIGNKNSKKFHLSSCDGVKNMDSKNKITFSSREDAIENGYTPCKTCNP